MWGGSGQQGTRKTQVEGLPLPRIFITKNKQKERKEKEKQKKMGRRGRKNTRKQTNIDTYILPKNDSVTYPNKKDTPKRKSSTSEATN